MMERTNLKELSARGVEDFLSTRGLPRYRSRQLLHWLYEKRAASLREITEFSRDLRASLENVAYVSGLVLLARQRSEDGTEKFLFGLEDGLSVESVLIPDGERLTLCVSSQVGCAMGCLFCRTGREGLLRNLKAHEMVDQVFAAEKAVEPLRVTNLVFMGMGEPLHNPGEVAEAVRRLTGLAGFSRKRITVSTAGYVPGMRALSEAGPHVRLAVSLNAATDAVRDDLMPINRRYPLPVLLEELRNYPLPKREHITIEYVLIEGKNDAPEDARRLPGLLRGIPSKINLIPLNEHDGTGLRRPSDSRVMAFQQALIRAGLRALVRKSKGTDILAACGQLRSRRREGAPSP
ncbi:MAG: 23S rRNA (adenine(2503)-C(2))-methyltransferase RlmN [Nitrospirota bacterium]